VVSGQCLTSWSEGTLTSESLDLVPFGVKRGLFALLLVCLGPYHAAAALVVEDWSVVQVLEPEAARDDHLAIVPDLIDHRVPHQIQHSQVRHSSQHVQH
jgi:hypothetical protein